MASNRMQMRSQAKAADGTGLTADVAEAHVSIQPARERWADRKTSATGVEIHGLYRIAERAWPHCKRNAEHDENRADDQTELHGDFREQAREVEAEKNNQGAGDGREGGAVTQ